MGTDILCQAKSGMGKTAVFVLTLLDQLDEKPDPVSAMVLTHNRELAHQIKKEFDRFQKYFENIKTEVIYGGIPKREHIKLLKDNPPTIVVGTPGRVLDLIKGKHLKLDNLKHFILDECDKMLEDSGNQTDPRHERRRDLDLRGDAPPEAGDDVLRHHGRRGQGGLPKDALEPVRGVHRQRLEADPARAQAVLRQAGGGQEDKEAGGPA